MHKILKQIAIAGIASLAPAAFTYAQTSNEAVPVHVKFGGHSVHYQILATGSAHQSGQCVTVYLKKDGANWIPEINGTPEKKAELLINKDLERVFACVAGGPGMKDDIRKGAPIPVSIVTAYFFEDCTNTESCEIPYKGIQFNAYGSWRYYSRLNRKKAYVAVNSAFLDEQAKDRGERDWVNYDAVVKAASHPDLLKAYRDQYFKYMLAEAKRCGDDASSLAAWFKTFGGLATDEAWAILTPKIISGDAVEAARSSASPQMLAQLTAQAKAYWLEKYRAEWAPYKNVEANGNNLAAFEELGKRMPSSDSGLAFRRVDFDNLAPVAQAKIEKFIAAQHSRAVAEEKARRKAEAALLADIEKRNAAWRKGLKIGAVTNCGPIIDIKESLMKVYAPVKDYGNEHWIERSSLYMPGERCFFLNGAYQPPYSAAQ